MKFLLVISLLVLGLGQPTSAQATGDSGKKISRLAPIVSTVVATEDFADESKCAEGEFEDTRTEIGALAGPVSYFVPVSVVSVLDREVSFCDTPLARTRISPRAPPEVVTSVV